MSKYELPDKYKSKIAKISKEIDEPNDTLVAEVTDRFIEFKNKYPDKSLDALWRSSYFVCGNRWRAILRALPWMGFFIGETEVRDWTVIIKRFIDNMPDNEKIKYITEADVYLNPFKESRNYLDPLPEHRYFKNMYGITGNPEFKEMSFTIIEWSGPLATKIPEHSFETLYKFRATQRKSESLRRLGGVTATKFDAINETKFLLSREQMEEHIKKLGPVKEFSRLRDYYDLLGKKKAAQEVVIVEAGVKTMGKSKTGYVMTLEAPEDVWVNPITAFVPEFIPLNFGKNSIVLALGTLFKDNSNRLCMNALGIFPTVEGILEPDSDLFG